jgi:azurin
MISVVTVALLLSLGAPPQAGTPRGAAKPQAASRQVRTVDILGTDDMKFDVTRITARRGEQLRIRLKSTGTMPKLAMGHNVVVLKQGVDATAFNRAALTARATDFVPPDRKQDVVAATALAGAGETVEVTVVVPAKPGNYTFICSFPGHFNAGMRGTLVVR